MDTFQSLLLRFVDLWISPLGQVFQSLLIVLICASSLSLIRNGKQQIYQKDLRRARLHFYTVIILHVVSIFLNLNLLYPLVGLQSQFYDAYAQFLWSISLLTIGWLWIKPARQRQYLIYKRSLYLAVILLFLLHTFKILEAMLAPSLIVIPYIIIWRALQYLAAIFLFFVYLNHSGRLLWTSFTFIFLQILGLSLEMWFIPPTIFFQGFTQTIAFLLSSQIFLVLTFDAFELERGSLSAPIILSENMSVIPEIKTIQAWLHASLKNDRSLIPYTLCKALAHTFYADACLLFQLGDDKNSIEIISGIIQDPLKPLLSSTLDLKSDIHLSNRSIQYHEAESFPNWMQRIIRKVRITRINSAWHTPFYLGKHKYYLLFLSHNIYWNDFHDKHLQKAKPLVVQILQKYLGEENSQTQMETLQPATSNPHLELMQSAFESDKDIADVESELKLALEEYNRIRKILEERGLGQQL